MPIAGKLSDEWGRKRLFMGAVGLFIMRFRYRLPMIVGLIIISASLFVLSRGLP